MPHLVIMTATQVCFISADFLCDVIKKTVGAVKEVHYVMKSKLGLASPDKFYGSEFLIPLFRGNAFIFLIPS